MLGFIIRLAFKNLTRHRKRTMITALLIAVAVFIYLLMDSLIVGMTDMSFRNVIDLEAGHLQAVTADYWEEREEFPLKHLLRPDSKVGQRLQDMPGFAASTPQLDFAASLNNGVDELPVIGRGIAPDSYRRVCTTEDYLAEGSLFAAGEYKIVIGKSLADLMDLKLGDYVTLLVRTRDGAFNTIDGEICGLLQTPNPNINENVVYVPLDLAQQALGVEGQVSRIIVRLEDRSNAVSLAGDLSRRWAEENLPVRAYSWEEVAHQVVMMSKYQNAENQVVLSIILLIAAVGIINTVLLSALERMEEIGMMKALGLKEGEIILTFAIEALGIGFLGGLAGCLSGAVAVGLFNQVGINFFAFGGEVETFGIPILGRVYGGWNPGAFVFVFSFGVVISFLASLLPARWAARKDPVKAIYHR